MANLIQLIGPVTRVVALAATPRTFRTIGSGPREGERMPVGTPTTVHAVLEVRSTSRVSCELHDAVARRALAQDTVMSVHF